MASHEVQVGTMLGGRYLVKQLLGRGGMGSVYEGVQIDLARPVALKVLGPEMNPRRLREEALAAAALVHPCIVHVTDFFPADGDAPPFLVMELLRGRPLDRWLAATGPLRPEVAARITSQILGALAAAHAANILHRDVKPANVFVLDPLDPDEPRIKLLDFGIAKMLDDPGRRATTTGQLLGTLGYMAPEQLRGEAAGPASDLYSTGVCLYQMLCGHRPFRDFIDALEREPAFPPDVDPKLAHVATIALAKNPRDRFANAEAMAEALREPPLPTVTAPRVAVAPEGVRSPIVSFAIATLATVAIGAVIAAIALARRPAAPPPSPSAAAGRTEAAVPEPSHEADARTALEADAEAPGEPVSPPAAAAARPKKLCVCKTGTAANAGVLCQELETRCECKDAAGLMVCDVRFSETCTTQVPKTARTGDPCSGFHRSWDHSVRVDTPATGQLVCSTTCSRAFAQAHPQMAVPFTPCRGTWNASQPTQPGIWIPSAP